MKARNFLNDKKTQKWMLVGFSALVASQFYFVREMLAALLLFTVAFLVIASIALVLYLLGQGSRWSFDLVGAHARSSFRSNSNPDVSHSMECDILGHIEFQRDQSTHREGGANMLRELLHLASRHDRKDVANGDSDSTHGSSNATYAGTDPGNDPNARSSHKSPASPQGDFLPLEDIYRAAGIISLQMEVGIDKVTEMLNSDHIRELSNDMRRASVLMALDVAGITVNEVLNDANRRLDAINSYEADQKKHFEEYEARKIWENAEIQLELERVTAHYLDRMKRNQNEVVQLRDQFTNWQTMKQQEAQRISEAVGVCVKRAASEQPSDSLSDATPAKPATVSEVDRMAEESAKAKAATA